MQKGKTIILFFFSLLLFLHKFTGSLTDKYKIDDGWYKNRYDLILSIIIISLFTQKVIESYPSKMKFFAVFAIVLAVAAATTVTNTNDGDAAVVRAVVENHEDGSYLHS